MPASWSNPKFKGDFTMGEYKDKKENFPDLTWKEYREMKNDGLNYLVEKNRRKIADEERLKQEKEAANYKYKMADIEAGLTDFDSVIDPDHYNLAIEPFDYIYYNDLGFAEGNVIKYITRWKQKNGIEDLKKAKQYIDMLINKEGYKNGL